MDDAFDKALSHRPTDPKEQAAARARWRRRLYGDKTMLRANPSAVLLAGLMESAYLNAELGSAWPSYSTLTQAIGRDRRTVARAISVLVSRGHLIARSGNPQRSNSYTLPWQDLHGESVIEEPNEARRGTGAPRGSDVTGQGHGCPQLGAWMPTDLGESTPLKQVDKNQHIEPVERTGPESDGVSPAVDAYNLMAERAGLPKCMKVTKARRSAIKARLKDAGGLDGWLAALEIVEGSAFLCGGGPRGWRADIDYISTDRGFTKIMEGSHSGPVRGGGDPSNLSLGVMARQSKGSDKLAAVSEVFNGIKRRQGE